MLGRHRDREGPQDTDAQVDLHLESDIDAVREAVVAFLQDTNDRSRRSVMEALENLDRQIDLGDAYAASIVDSAAFGGAPKGSVVGETSNHSAAEEIPAQVFRAQVAMVRAAKVAVQDRDPSTLQDLRTASALLATAMGRPDTA